MVRSATLSFAVILVSALVQPGGFFAHAETSDDDALRTVAEVGTIGETLELLSRGANPNAPDEHGRTAVHYAADRGAEGIMQLLLEAGGDPNRRDKHDDTPLHLAAYAPDPPLPVSSSIVLIRMLLNAGADAGATNSRGRTPLHLAAYGHNFPDGVADLLDHGGAPNRQDQSGDTALHIAVAHNAYPAVVRALLAGGADPGIENGDRLTPLQLLAARGPDMGASASLLLAAGADPDRKYANGDTMLHAAIRRSTDGYPGIAQALLDGGAEPCVRGSQDYLPYEIAVEGGIIHQALDRADGHDLACPDTESARQEEEGVPALSTDEWRRIQSALADRGFDPGPADGMPGPRTHSAVEAWQRSEGYAATGALTEAQAGELLAGAPEPQSTVSSFGPGWIVADNQSCQLYSEQHKQKGTVTSVTWSGDCADGKASGEGTAVFRGVGDYGERRFEGFMHDGWPFYGQSNVRLPDGMARTCEIYMGSIVPETCTPWQKATAAQTGDDAPADASEPACTMWWATVRVTTNFDEGGISQGAGKDREEAEAEAMRQCEGYGQQISEASGGTHRVTSCQPAGSECLD